MTGAASTKLSKLLEIVDLSGELEIGRCGPGEPDQWYGFTWLSGYVNGGTPEAVIDEIITEAKRNKMRRLPVVQIRQRESYLRRKYNGRQSER